jgi:hypothetical protein
VALTPPTKSAAAVSLRKAKSRFLSPVPRNLGEFRSDFDTSIVGERNFRRVFGSARRFPAPHKEKIVIFQRNTKDGQNPQIVLARAKWPCLMTWPERFLVVGGGDERSAVSQQVEVSATIFAAMGQV